MWRTVFRFEIIQQLRKPFTWIFLLLMVVQGVYYMHHAGEFYSADKTFANAPAILYTVMAGMGYVGFIVVAILGGAALGKDLDSRTTAILFTTGVRQSAFFWGRYTGSLLTLLMLYAGYLAGILLYNVLPVPNLGPFSGEAFVKGILLIFLPNVLVLYSLCFAVTVFTRSSKTAYAVGMGGMLLMIFGETTFESNPAMVLVDPTGFSVLHSLLLHMSPAEKNVFSPAFSGYLFYNRIIWLLTSLIALLAAYRVFSFRTFGVVKHVKEKEKEETTSPVIAVHTVTPVFSLATDWRHAWSLSWLAFKSVVRPVGFRLFLSLIFVIYICYMAVWQQQYYSAAPTLPVTVEITKVTNPLAFYLLLFIIINTTELLFREQVSGFWQIGDALPVPSWVNVLSKVFAMIGVVILMAAALMFFGIVVQVCRGYYHFNFQAYWTDIFVRWVPKYICYILLVTFVAGLTANRYATHWICILFLVVGTVLNEIEVIEQHRFNFIFSPGSGMDTDMNGNGIFSLAHGWYMLYWCSLALAMLGIGLWIWQRGTPVGLWTRMKNRKMSPVFAIIFLGGLTVFALCSNRIYDTVNVQNQYQDKATVRAEQALYEQTYKRYARVAQPLVQQLALQLDLYPASRKAVYTAGLLLQNHAGVAIDTLHVEWMDLSKIDTVSGVKLLQQDTVLRHAMYVFDKPLQPGDTVRVQIKGHLQYEGFTNGDPQRDLTFNGSYLSDRIVPFIGYDEDRELKSNQYRTQYGLEKLKARIAPVTDTIAARRHFTSTQAGALQYAFTIGTSAEQVVVAPGRLEKSWQEGDRAYYRYVSEGVGRYDFHVLSAAYAIRRDTVQVGVHPVVIEVYHHPEHGYNIQALTRVAREALGTLDSLLGAYPYSTLRIAERPHYAEDLDAFGNVIVLPENHGWIADIHRQEDLDYLRFITTKLIAEQYMAQANISRTAGYPLLTHAVPAYLALQQLRRYHGEAALQRHLDKDRDNYLKGRAAEVNEEPALIYADAEAAYVYNEKGGAELYRLSREMGSGKMDSIIAQFLQAARRSDHLLGAPDFYTKIPIRE